MNRSLPGLLLLLPLGATAAGAPYLDLYYVPKARFEAPGIGDGNDDGDGRGAKGVVPVGTMATLTGEYQTNTFDESGLDFPQKRLGIGWTGETRSGLYAEYVDLDLQGVAADGYAVQGRLEGLPDAANVFTQVGYLMLNNDAEDLTGLEYLAGVAFPFNPRAGGFLDYRQTRLTGRNSDIDYNFTDIRLGLRIAF